MTEMILREKFISLYLNRKYSLDILRIKNKQMKLN